MLDKLKHQGTVISFKEVDAPFVSSSRTYQFIYSPSQSLVEGFLVVPGDESKQYPCVIFNRGGSENRGLIGNNANLKRMHALAGFGYVVIASQYSGCGLGTGSDEFGGQDLDDVLFLREILCDIPAADVSRLAMYGESRGGMMCYLASTRVDWIKTVISNCGIADLTKLIKYRPDMVDILNQRTGGTAESLKNRSVIYFAEQMSASTSYYLIHGTLDTRVMFEDSVCLAAALSSFGRKNRLELIADGDHTLLSHPQVLMDLLKQWLAESL
jgi:dipeptidyl aminopeptidase/acylaminoacyl peptidase